MIDPQSIAPGVLLIKVTFQPCWIFYISIFENKCIENCILCVFVTEHVVLKQWYKAGRETATDFNNIVLAALVC